MPQSYRVDFQFQGLAAGIQQLRQLNQQMRQSAGMQRQAAAGAGGGMVRFGSGGGPGRTPAGMLGGPNYRLAQAQQRLSILQGMGAHPQAIQDAQGAVQRAQAGVARQQQMLSGGASPAQKLAQVLLTSRFGAGGLMPLVGRSLAALGVGGAAAGPAALVMAGLAAVGVGLHAFVSMLGEAASALSDFRAAAMQSGGSTGDISRLTSMGMSPGSIAGKAAALTQRMSMLGGDPFAMLAGMKLGVQLPIGRPFGKTNEAETFLAVIEGLRKVKSAEEQLRLARMLGVDADMDLVRASDKVFEAMKRDAALRTKFFDERTQQNAADVSAGFIRVNNAMDNLKVTLSKPFLADMANALAGLAEIMNTVAAIMNKNAIALRAALAGALTIVFGPLAVPLLGALSALGGKGQKDHQSALDQNTDALNNLAGVFKEGTYGGGERTRGAVPSALKGLMLGGAIAGNSLRLGAFTL